MEVITLDNRGLTPPEPMVRILGALAALPEDGQLRALMDREPFPLYAELTRRGFAWDFTVEGELQVLTVWRPA